MTHSFADKGGLTLSYLIFRLFLTETKELAGADGPDTHGQHLYSYSAFKNGASTLKIWD